MTDMPPLDFHQFHLQKLPKLLVSANGLIAAKLSRELAPLCIRLKDTDNAYTYQPREATVDIIAGTESDVVLELDQIHWQRLVRGEGLLTVLPKSPVFDVEQSFFSQWQKILKAMFYC